MQDVLNLVERLSKQSDPWIIFSSVCVCAFFLWRLLRETLNQGHAIAEKRLQLLLSYIDKKIETQHRFSVEQAFAQQYGRQLTYDEICYCLAQPNPSQVAQSYVWAYGYLEFNKTKQLPGPRSGGRPNKRLNTIVGTSAYALAVAALAVAAGGAATHLPREVIGTAVAACVALGTTFWFALMQVRSIEAFERVLAGRPAGEISANPTMEPALAPASAPESSGGPAMPAVQA